MDSEDGLEKKTDPVETFDFAAWKKMILGDPRARAVIEDFLKNRHRDWEQ